MYVRAAGTAGPQAAPYPPSPTRTPTPTLAQPLPVRRPFRRGVVALQARLPLRGKPTLNRLLALAVAWVLTSGVVVSFVTVLGVGAASVLVRVPLLPPAGA